MEHTTETFLVGDDGRETSILDTEFRVDSNTMVLPDPFLYFAMSSTSFHYTVVAPQTRQSIPFECLTCSCDYLECPFLSRDML